MDQDVFETICQLADRYAAALREQVDLREQEMKEDDTTRIRAGSFINTQARF